MRSENLRWAAQFLDRFRVIDGSAFWWWEAPSFKAVKMLWTAQLRIAQSRPYFRCRNRINKTQATRLVDDFSRQVRR
jgi:hypothetical protein